MSQNLNDKRRSVSYTGTDQMLLSERGVKNVNLDSSCILSTIDKTTNERGRDMENTMPKVRVLMTETQNGRDDDKIATDTFVKGQEYTIGASLAHVFIKQIKVATEVNGKAAEAPENKALKVNENKDKKPAAKKKPAKKAAAKKDKAKK